MISIIVSTLNRSSSLLLAVESFCKQNISSDLVEILIIDNGSTDNTKSIVENSIETFPASKIRYIYEPEPGSLSGRHRGALAAEGEILTFVDDDIVADIDWLQAIKTSFDDPTVQIVGGRNLPNYEIEPPEWLEWFWEEHPDGKLCCQLSLLDFGDLVRDIDANYVWSLNFSIRKHIFFELGGFHPDYLPQHLSYLQGDGETGLTRNANLHGCRAIYQPQALIWHRVDRERMSYAYFERRSYFQGVCDSYSEIRAANGGLTQVSFIEKIKARLRDFQQLVTKSIESESDKDALKGRFDRAYRNGYQFHQAAVRQHPKLLEWILKKDYWDYLLPELKFSDDRNNYP